MSWWHPAVRYKGPDVFGSTEAFNAAYAKNNDGNEADYIEAGSAACGAILQMAIEKAGTVEPVKVRDAIAATDTETFYGHVRFIRRPDQFVAAAGVSAGRRQAGNPLARRHQVGRNPLHAEVISAGVLQEASRRTDESGGIKDAHDPPADRCEWPGARRAVRMHRGRLLAGVGRAQRHQHPARLVHRAGLVRCVFRLRSSRHSSVHIDRDCGRRALRARLCAAGRHHQPRGHSTSADHADVDVRPRSHPEQRDAGRVHRRLSGRQPRQPARHVEDRPGVPAGRPCRRDGAGAAADCVALPAAARQPHRARHRRGPHGPRGGGADGRRRQAHQCDHLRGRRVHGGRGRRAAQHHLSDFAAEWPAVSRQGLRGLRSGWPRQRAGRDGRRTGARRHRELRLVLARSGARDDAVVRLCFLSFFSCARAASWAGGGTNERIGLRLPSSRCCSRRFLSPATTISFGLRRRSACTR